MPKYTGLKQHHLTISVYPEQWDKIVFDSSSSGKTVSRYISDKVLKYISDCNGVAPIHNIEKNGDKHKVKSLTFYEEDYQFIRNTAKECGMKQSEFIRNIVLYF